MFAALLFIWHAMHTIHRPPSVVLEHLMCRHFHIHNQQIDCMSHHIDPSFGRHCFIFSSMGQPHSNVVVDVCFCKMYSGCFWIGYG